MKNKIRHLIAAFLVVCIMCTTAAPVLASGDYDDEISTQASRYIISTYAYAETGSSTGTINIQFNISANGKMTSLGASKIQIYNTSGTCVKTFYASSTSGMLGSNRYAFSSYVTYSGKSGSKYYAVVTFKASDSSGGDSCTYTTEYATAK